MSRSCASIWASARSRRPTRNCRASGETSVTVGGVGVVGDRQVAVFGNNYDLLTAIATSAVLPHHRFQNQDHAGWEDELVVEVLAQIGSDHGGFGGVGSDAVAEVEVRQPRFATAVGGYRRPRQVA